MYVCMHACMHACMYVCMCICIICKCIHIYIYTQYIYIHTIYIYTRYIYIYIHALYIYIHDIDIYIYNEICIHLYIHIYIYNEILYIYVYCIHHNTILFLRWSFLTVAAQFISGHLPTEMNIQVPTKSSNCRVTYGLPTEYQLHHALQRTAMKDRSFGNHQIIKRNHEKQSTKNGPANKGL